MGRNGDDMHIFSAADEKYAPHFCVTLHSAWLFHPHANYTLVARDISESTLQKLHAFADARSISLEIMRLEPDRLQGLPVPPGFGITSYARLFLPELLPTVARGIYLDADIVVNGSLDGLYSMDMQGLPVAAVPDTDGGLAVEALHRRLPDGFRYHNTGVMLIDLAMWRREDIAEQLLSFSRNTTEILPFLDQSAMNLLLQGRILSIDRRYNPFALEHFEEVPDPAVIHFAGNRKPWKTNWSAFHHLYRLHRNQTPWPLHDPGPSAVRLLKQRIGALIGIPRYRSLPQDIVTHRRMRSLTGETALKRAEELIARRQ